MGLSAGSFPEGGRAPGRHPCEQEGAAGSGAGGPASDQGLGVSVGDRRGERRGSHGCRVQGLGPGLPSAALCPQTHPESVHRPRCPGWPCLLCLPMGVPPVGSALSPHPDSPTAIATPRGTPCGSPAGSKATHLGPADALLSGVEAAICGERAWACWAGASGRRPWAPKAGQGVGTHRSWSGR